MYAEIHAEDPLNRGVGRSIRLSDNDFDLEIMRDDPEEPSWDVPWVLQLMGTEESYGPHRYMDRKVTIQLNPDDIKRVITFLDVSGLLTVGMKDA